MNAAITEEQYQKFISGLCTSDRGRCTQVVKELVAAEIDIRDLYVDLFQRALYEVGESWARGQISVAVEHAATAIVDRMLTLVQPKVFIGPDRPHTAVIACVTDEYHQLGARIIADVFELNGWRCYFLGANTPLEDLIQLVHQHQPDVVGLSLSIYFNMPSLLETYAALREKFPDQMVILGGQAFRWGGTDVFDTDPLARYVPSLHDLEHYIHAYEPG